MVAGVCLDWGLPLPDAIHLHTSCPAIHSKLCTFLTELAAVTCSLSSQASHLSEQISMSFQSNP